MDSKNHSKIDTIPDVVPPAPIASSHAEAPASSTKPSSVSDLEAYFRKLVAEKMKKGLPKLQAERAATAQINRDAEQGMFGSDVVKQWRATSSQPKDASGASAPKPGTPAADIEAEFKKLVSDKMAKGLKREDSVAVATRQIQRDASLGKHDLNAVTQWLTTVAQRKGSPLLGIR